MSFMAKTEEFKLGGDILSYCGKCKMPMGHIINSLTKKGGVDKCECTTCKALHKYRDPEKVAAKAAGTTKRKGTKKVGPTSEELWTEAVAKAEGPARAYQMGGEFFEGDLIEHTKFGKGVVVAIIDQKKFSVVFEGGEKVLVHNR